MIEAISSAIRLRRVLRVSYDPGERLVEPHCLGWGSEGQVLLRAFQVSGASASSEHREWKLFRLDRMVRCIEGGDEFPGARPLYNPNDRVMKGGIIARL